MSIHLLRNPVREYAWGSRRALAELRGEPVPSPRPQAELWMGAHARASSELQQEGRWRSLRSCIEAEPARWLGEASLARFGPELPFLFKVLAVAQPLSLQAHPDHEQARRGFEAEEARGVAPDAPERTYPDPRAKPELVCALSPFRALCGFRPRKEARRLWQKLDVESLDTRLGGDSVAATGEALAAVLRLPAWERAPLAHAVTAAARRLGGDADSAYADLLALAEQHPEDVALLAPLLLEAVALRPGDALYLEPGQLHTYLAGNALELMASSDNVVRGGLTPKPVDVEELLAVADLEARRPLRPTLREIAPGEQAFETPCASFQLSRFWVEPGAPLSRQPAGPEILLCLAGEIVLEGPSGAGLTLGRGQSAFVEGSAKEWKLSGHAELYRASLPAA